MSWLVIPSLLVVVMLAVAVQPTMAVSPPDTLVVSPQGPYTTIIAALNKARAGDRVEVHGGTYAGPIVVEKPVALVGINEPVIDGGDRGTVITIAAPDVRLAGFVIRNSGDSLDREDAGVVVLKARRVVIANNRIENTLFGIYVKDSPETQVQGNYIAGMDLALPRRGDGIRFWQSPNSLIAENTVRAVRDCILWFSDNSLVRDNDVHGGRYGLHLMYDNDIEITGNTLADNHVGAFLMYSRRITLRGNTFQNNRGPSGYGVGLKDMDRVVGEDNLFVSNRIGLYLDNSPWSLDEHDVFRHNAFAYNDIGLSFQPAVKRNIFSENTFLENLEQVSIRGGGQLEGNTWSVGGRGNFWSDYAGYDADGDGLGDLPYQPQSLFESLLDRHSSLRLFLMSPAQQAIDMASRAFPIVRPKPKFTDAAPLLSPVLPAVTPGSRPSPWPMLSVSGGIVLLILLGLSRGIRIPQVSRSRPFDGLRTARGERGEHAPPSLGLGGGAEGGGSFHRYPLSKDMNMIDIRGLTKRFGRFTAVDNFDLSVKPGEAVALWGPNGAGKTTIIKCLLGLLRFDGSVTINGYDLGGQGKALRRSLGYVPQELAFYSDLTAEDTARFYATLKGISVVRVHEVLAQVGLTEHAGKAVAALSGGMKQRLALGVALLSDPPLLVLDEPTSNLDAQARDDFLALLLNLKHQGKTLLFTSHRLEEVEALADRVLALDRGQLRVECEPRALAAALGLHVILRVYIPDSEIERALTALQAQGFTASRNGSGVHVQVAPTDKAAPIQALAQANIRVHNFEVENGSSWN